MNSSDNTAVGEGFERTRNRAISGAHKGIDVASNAVHPAVDRVAAGAHQAVNAIDQAAAKTAETLAERSQQLRDAQSRFAERCSSRISEKPLTSLGIAIAAGFLLAALFRRR